MRASRRESENADSSEMRIASHEMAAVPGWSNSTRSAVRAAASRPNRSPIELAIVSALSVTKAETTTMTSGSSATKACAARRERPVEQLEVEEAPHARLAG